MSTSSDARLHFEGVLDKAGKRFFEGFRKRWFTLDGQDLTYYKAPEKTEENYLGHIDFSQVKAVNPVKMVNNGFQIVTKSRTYTFSAPTPELLTDWVSVLRQAMQLKSIEKRNRSLSCQDPISSQYEEVSSRSLRSLSTDHSLDEFDAADLLYSSVSEPGNQHGASSQGQGEYGLVGPATLPRVQRNNDDAVMYELVGSRPPSKSAPPTYEMVQSSKKNTVESAEGLYDLVQNVQPQESPKPLEEGSTGQEEPAAPQIHADTDAEKQEQTSLYSTVTRDRSRKKKPSVRGLSMITEGENEEVEELSPVPTPEETAPSLPAKSVDEVYAIYEIKRFLEETATEDEGNGISYQKTNGKEEEPDAFPVRSGSAFQQLKAFLQELDSTESD